MDGWMDVNILLRKSRLRHNKQNKTNPYLNPRSVREEVLVDYLLDEGFASDEKSAQAIVNSMSEEWIESIIEKSDDSHL